ncbi:MAG: glycoside hydrolase family 2 [Clostridia bacterium]|nr:glycoside hydrolase family 2 [Clostridia bacterium]
MKQDNTRQILTREGEWLLYSGETPWDVYPRPGLRRDSFFNLNGTWQITVNGGPSENITVPFVPQSLLSGINRRLGKNPCLSYFKTFTLPDGFVRDRVILHFGAVDQCAKVTLNGWTLGEHRGGYGHFSFDVTDCLTDENILTVEVTDRLDGILPYGKQREKRGGMWYTPVTGIWQTVWLESVPAEYVKSLEIRTTLDTVTIRARGVKNGKIRIETGRMPIFAELDDGTAEIRIPEPQNWTPENPYLYRFTLTAGEDVVQSYFALRTLEVKTVDGIARLCLNGKPYFFHGLLDQGYFSDGIYTPASPDSFTRDITEMKKLGFNMLRKHIKVEPDWFYYECDRLGMAVFQDMVNNGRYSFLRDTALPTIGLKKRGDKNLHANPQSRQAFLDGMEETVSQLGNFPCIVYWTIFNEGWGQFDGESAYNRLKQLDSTRFIDTASGWFSGVPSDVESLHVYFKPVKLKPSDRPIVLSEFGGYACKVENHAFNPDKTYGYRKYDDCRAFENAFAELYENEIIPAVKQGLCAAVYTQVSDVEDETNGLLTYDRWVTKVDVTRVHDMSLRLKLRIN